MGWRGISEEGIWDLINQAASRMTVHQERFWDAIRILPERWVQHPYGNENGGFWAVAVMGRIVVWYNDIEGGFNFSRYSTYGTIDQYFANQEGLEFVIQELMEIVRTGYGIGGQAGPPRPGPYPG
ncbi:hypothetical protein KXS07_06160 [Inquilinus limosus]|uniref:hypothetical protein n=1 Tax=Inquilinus limosus TaxID=171674 RepID=UPI003F17AC4F